MTDFTNKLRELIYLFVVDISVTAAVFVGTTVHQMSL